MECLTNERLKFLRLAAALRAMDGPEYAAVLARIPADTAMFECAAASLEAAMRSMQAVGEFQRALESALADPAVGQPTDTPI